LFFVFLPMDIWNQLMQDLRLGGQTFELLSSDPPRRREYGGRGGGLVTTKKIRQIEVTERNLFYWSLTT